MDAVFWAGLIGSITGAVVGVTRKAEDPTGWVLDSMIVAVAVFLVVWGVLTVVA